MAYAPKEDRELTMAEQLALEAENKAAADLLFFGHRVKDISDSLAERKSGTDFLLSIRNPDGTESFPIRCENKFEQYTFGNVALEVVSVDRQRVPGWLYTSQAGWLFSWFRNAGDLLVCPMDEVRALVLPNITRHRATTAKNKSYLSWNVLENINYLLLNIENSRVLDLRYELGDKPIASSMVSRKAQHKRCKVEELVELMRKLPPSSKHLEKPSNAQLEDTMRRLAPLNLKAKAHADRIRQLSFLNTTSIKLAA